MTFYNFTRNTNSAQYSPLHRTMPRVIQQILRLFLLDTIIHDIITLSTEVVFRYSLYLNRILLSLYHIINLYYS